MGILEYLKLLFGSEDTVTVFTVKGRRGRRRKKGRPQRQKKNINSGKKLKRRPVKMLSIRPSPRKKNVSRRKKSLTFRKTKPVRTAGRLPAAVSRPISTKVPKQLPSKEPARAPAEKKIGVITHYFDKISVGVIKLRAPLSVNERIHLKGNLTDFYQTVNSMQIDRKDVSAAGRGADIGIKVTGPVRENDVVYKA